MMTTDELFDKMRSMKAEVDKCLDRLMDDEELYLEYLEKFPKNPNIVELKKAVDARDAKKACDEAHTLKGVGLNLGLLPLVDVCSDMVLDFRAGDEEAGFAGMEATQAEFDKWASLFQEAF